MTRSRAWSMATTGIVSTAEKKSLKSASAHCLSRSAARTARKHGKSPSSVSVSSLPAAGPARCSSTCKSPASSYRGFAGGGAHFPPPAFPWHSAFGPECRTRNEVAMSDQLENLKAEDLSIGDRLLSIPSELPVLPLRD